jgi:hypothetical protein
MKRFVVTALLLALATVFPLAQAKPAPDVVGEWEMKTLSPVGESTNTVEFRKTADAIKAFAKGPQGEREYEKTTIEGDKLTLVITVNYEGNPMTITYFGTITEDSINGSADFGGLADGSFAMTRKPAAK